MILREADGNSPIAWPLAEFGAHLRLANGFLDDGSEDAILATCLRNAAAAVERQIGQALIARGFELKVSRWDRDGHLVLPVGPVAGIARLALVSGAAVIEVPPTSWELEPGTTRQRLTGAGGAALSPIPTGYWAELSFAAGHASGWDGVPGDLAQAVMLMAAHFYEFRGGHGRAAGGMPAEAAAILDRHRAVRL
ncbi:hypothetical protein M1105_01090 [Limibaculum sp. FT325]|uniref:head-tail connector protein n=1 Tax=Thermohalobaculum sediminis TaxID=2939436 RepID=UPI0020BE87C6|nr:hypothetical protein [Limibaculum sediminis]MCL5775590.1 hypothetical protein [Limibaculum sediminis]